MEDQEIIPLLRTLLSKQNTKDSLLTLDPAREMLCHIQWKHLETGEKKWGESCSRFSLVFRIKTPHPHPPSPPPTPPRPPVQLSQRNVQKKWSCACKVLKFPILVLFCINWFYSAFESVNETVHVNSWIKKSSHLRYWGKRFCGRRGMKDLLERFHGQCCLL